MRARLDQSKDWIDPFRDGRGTESVQHMLSLEEILDNARAKDGGQFTDSAMEKTSFGSKLDKAEEEIAAIIPLLR